MVIFKILKKLIIFLICIFCVFFIILNSINSIKNYKENQDYSYRIGSIQKNKIHKIENRVKTNENSNNEEWYIEIPKIGLKANIAEGTDEDTLNEHVGHFEDTSLLDGNIGLAAHNRGYKVNYFSKIKELEKDDIIYYYYKGYKREYKVNLKEIIEDTNWEFLESTEENKITLITCVEDMPEFRRCIQAIEIK